MVRVIDLKDDGCSSPLEDRNNVDTGLENDIKGVCMRGYDLKVLHNYLTLSRQS